MYLCMSACTHINESAHIYVFMYVSMNIYIYVVNVYIHWNICRHP